jgi:carbon monoxide dehydrogenase subunit G
MGDLSYFESRSGRLNSTPEDVFKFVTDLRNLDRFISGDTVNNWQVQKDSCSFNVPMLGTVSLQIAGKEEFQKVVYNGDALRKNDFSMVLNIYDNGFENPDVKVSLNADLDPMMKMVASKPILQFLETLISKMESFDGWKEIKE